MKINVVLNVVIEVDADTIDAAEARAKDLAKDLSILEVVREVVGVEFSDGDVISPN